jgi:RNA polymerase sigma-70 factor, ECF subfamily
LEAASPDRIREPALSVKELSGLDMADLWRQADAGPVDLGMDELERVLLSVGAKFHYGVAAGAAATRAQVRAFWQGLQLEDLALAHACALGRERAWQRFLERFRGPLAQAATGMTGSATLGEELAGALASEMFGLAERDGQRRSPLALYSGRGSLLGFLRASLAQRSVDHHRRTGRETALAERDFPAAAGAPPPAPELLARLGGAVAATLGSLEAEERFLLSSWYLDGRTLLEISRVLRVHEATVSRKLKRITARLHDDLLRSLQASGMSRAAADEALGTDPRDLDVNLRSLLQASQPGAFQEQGPAQGREPA